MTKYGYFYILSILDTILKWTFLSFYDMKVGDKSLLNNILSYLRMVRMYTLTVSLHITVCSYFITVRDYHLRMSIRRFSSGYHLVSHYYDRHKTPYPYYVRAAIKKNETHSCKHNALFIYNIVQAIPISVDKYCYLPTYCSKSLLWLAMVHLFIPLHRNRKPEPVNIWKVMFAIASATGGDIHPPIKSLVFFPVRTVMDVA